MSKQNAFHELQKELEEKFTEEKEQLIKNRVQGSVGSLAFIAEIIELFFTKLFTVLVGKGAPRNQEK